MDSKVDLKQKLIDPAEEEALFGNQAPFASHSLASVHPSINPSVNAKLEEPFIQPHVPTDAPPEYTEYSSAAKQRKGPENEGPIFPAYKDSAWSSRDNQPSSPSSSRSNHPQGHAQASALPSAPQDTSPFFPQQQQQYQQSSLEQAPIPSSPASSRSHTQPLPRHQQEPQQQPEDQQPLLGQYRTSPGPLYGAASGAAQGQQQTSLLRSPQLSVNGSNEDSHHREQDNIDTRRTKGNMRSLKGYWSLLIKKRTRNCSIFVWICILAAAVCFGLKIYGGRDGGSRGGSGGGGVVGVCNLEKTPFVDSQELVLDITDGFELNITLPADIHGNILVREATDWTDPSVYFRYHVQTSTGELLDRTFFYAYENRSSHWEYRAALEFQSPQERDQLLNGKNCVRGDLEIIFPMWMKTAKELYIRVGNTGNVELNLPFVDSIFQKVDIETKQGDVHIKALNVLDRIQVRVGSGGHVSGAIKTVGQVDVQVGKGGGGGGGGRGGIALEVDAQTVLLGTDDRRLNVTMAVEGEGSVALTLVRPFQGYFSTVSESGKASFRKDEGLKQIVHHSKQREGLDVGWVTTSGGEPSSLLPRVDLRTKKGDATGIISGTKRRDYN